MLLNAACADSVANAIMLMPLLRLSVLIAVDIAVYTEFTLATITTNAGYAAAAVRAANASVETYFHVSLLRILVRDGAGCALPAGLAPSGLRMATDAAGVGTNTSAGVGTNTSAGGGTNTSAGVGTNISAGVGPNTSAAAAEQVRLLP